MKLIVGLGNPGPDYERTRHNIGWQVVDAFAAKFRIALDTHEKNAMTGRGRVAGGAVMVAKPLTFMNLSGDAVKLLINGYLESPAEMIVVYDDVDLPIGKLRIRPNGSSGTHNGMRSIVEVLGTEDFPRLRVGVRGERFGENPLRDYVLDDFDPDEQEPVAESVTRAIDALTLFVRDDLKRAMNQFNRDPTPDDNLPNL
ncbi:MAG: aminoacyl-tRNA hydrolase [Thermoanaerobaculia bacterium]|nr:aminoacyl-tRNA hydrolase [Thermoanaerobaculia bacterium]